MSRQYLSAGSIVDEVGRGKSIKSLCAKVEKLSKVDYALALQTLKYRTAIQTILSTCNVSAASLDVQEGVLLVMVYELLFGEGKIQGGGCVKRRVLEHLDAIRTQLGVMMQGKEQHAELLSESVLAYSRVGSFIRVNSFKTEMQEGIQYVHKICPAQVDEFIPSLIPIPAGISFGENEWVKSGRLVIQDKASCFPSQILYDAWCSQGCGDIGGGGKGGITREISDNIGSGSGSGGSSNSDRGNSDIGAGTREPGTYGSGCGGDIIDACAAPGNKTSHIAALIALTKDANTKNPKSKGSKDKAGGDMDKNPSRVFAFEKNPRRAALLRQRMELMGAHNVVVVNEDFLLADVHNPLFANVTAILLDPSCSGSGVVRSLERALEQDSAESLGLPTDTAKRLNKLQAFQLQAVHKAMCFPHVSNVVYSTCSIHLEENEHVVARVLSWCGDSGDGGGGVGGRESSGSGNSSGGREWTVEAPGRFKTWSRRGLPLTDTNTDTDTDTDTGCTLTAVESQALIRCAPEDGTNGFFVALFSKNPHFRGASVSSGQIGYSGYSGKSGSGRKNVGVADQKPVLKRQREDGVTAQKVSMAKPAKGEKVDGTVSTPSVPKPPRTPRVDSSLFGSRFKVSKASRKSKH